MTTIVVKPLAVYAAGTYTVPPTSVPNSFTRFRMDIARCTSADNTVWPNSTDTISYMLTCSTNGGPFYELGDGSDTGGIVLNGKTHVEVPFMTMDSELPVGENRIISGTATLSAAIKTSVTVTVT